MLNSNIKDLIDYKQFEKVFKENILDVKNLNLLITDLNFNILFQAGSLTTLTKKIFLVTNEIYPFSYLYENRDTLDSVIAEFVNGDIIIPSDFLYNKKTLVYCALVNDPDKKNVISYKDMNNLNSEVNRILTFVDTENLLINFLENLSISTDSLASEFLWINEDKPNMLLNNRIIIYLSLLNYSYEEISRTNFFKAHLKKLISKEIPLNWDQLRIIFKDFLKELSERTINY